KSDFSGSHFPFSCVTASLTCLESRLLLGVFFHPRELMAPHPFECARPFPERTNRHSIHSIKHLASLPSNVHEADFLQHLEVLRNRGLLHCESVHDFADRALLHGDVVEDVATARLGHGVESVGGCGCAWHGSNIFPYRNMSRIIFFGPWLWSL